jgi:hypothetical protein
MDIGRMDEITRGHATVADKIRALAAEGVARADIARFLGKRYQHVRNVLEGDAQSSGGYVVGRVDLSGVGEEPTRFATEGDDAREIDRRGPGVYWLRVRPDGSLPLPRELAEALGAPERRVFATWKDGELVVISAETALRQAQELVCRIIPPEIDLAASLIAERRAEAAREAADD